MLSAGLQAILPGYLQSRFIQAALNYIGCKSEGQFVCQSSDCWCECSVDFPQCNCPHSDLDTLGNNMLRIRDTWRLTNQEFEESGESEINSMWPSKMGLENVSLNNALKQKPTGGTLAFKIFLKGLDTRSQVILCPQKQMHLNLNFRAKTFLFFFFFLRQGPSWLSNTDSSRTQYHETCQSLCQINFSDAVKVLRTAVKRFIYVDCDQST